MFLPEAVNRELNTLFFVDLQRKTFDENEGVKMGMKCYKYVNYKKTSIPFVFGVKKLHTASSLKMPTLKLFLSP